MSHVRFSDLHHPAGDVAAPLCTQEVARAADLEIPHGEAPSPAEALRRAERAEATPGAAGVDDAAFGREDDPAPP